MSLPFQTPGYEDMELSTQILIAEALQRGITVELLDRSEQFIALKKGRHVELVKEASKTSQDSYISSLIMENKEVTKMLLRKVGLRVPESGVPLKQSIVVKPKSTNFGLGISILKTPYSKADFQKALHLAESYGPTLVEEFIEGMEYRFLVIAGKCRAVLHRRPASVLGNGTQNIRSLVKEKNKDPRRGLGHVSPLEKIQLGSIEKNVLRKHGYTFDSIPKKNERVYLRENSNISTGGDSLDATDAVLPAYKQLAEKAAQAIPAQVCGVDMIIKNYKNPPTAKNYAIIELNFNPVLYFHNFPYEGKNRHVECALLDLLFGKRTKFLKKDRE